MTSKSKNKGNTLEREVCNMFNTAFNCKEFARTPGSGAIMGLSNAAKNAGLQAHAQQTLGSDLICPDWFKFSVECKNYADDPNYAKIIYEDYRVLNGWLGEAIYDSRTFNLTPLLVFRTSRKGTFIAIPDMFPIPVDIKHYLKYDGFTIVGMDYFLQHIKHFNDFNTTISNAAMQRYLNSERSNQLVDGMLEGKKKK